MKKANELVHSFNHTPDTEGNFNGLTKLEYFTAMAMQGILSNSPDWQESEHDKDWVAKNSVEYAVKTLEQLEALNK